MNEERQDWDEKGIEEKSDIARETVKKENTEKEQIAIKKILPEKHDEIGIEEEYKEEVVERVSAIVKKVDEEENISEDKKVHKDKFFIPDTEILSSTPDNLEESINKIDLPDIDYSSDSGDNYFISDDELLIEEISGDNIETEISDVNISNKAGDFSS